MWFRIRSTGIRKKEKERESGARHLPRLQPCAAARENRRERILRHDDDDVGPSGRFERQFLAERDRNAEARFINECHLTIWSVG